MTPRNSTRVKAITALVVVFIFGGVTGATLTSVYYTHRFRSERRWRNREDFFEEMRRELNLNDAQAEQIRSILSDTRADLRALGEEFRPRFDAVRQRERERIRAVLTPDQQKRFDEMTARAETMRGMRRREKS
jgi:Spy/CpxP family protein refolding chaperone